MEQGRPKRGTRSELDYHVLAGIKKKQQIDMASRGDDDKKSTKSGRGAKSQKKSVKSTGKSVAEEAEPEGKQKYYVDMTPHELRDTIADLTDKIETNPGRLGHMHDETYRRMGDRFLSEIELPTNLDDDEVYKKYKDATLEDTKLLEEREKHLLHAQEISQLRQDYAHCKLRCDRLMWGQQVAQYHLDIQEAELQLEIKEEQMAYHAKEHKLQESYQDMELASAVDVEEEDGDKCMAQWIQQVRSQAVERTDETRSVPGDLLERGVLIANSN